MTTAPHRWKKSSRSSTGTNCVELAYAGLVRDSKQGDAGPVLSVRELPEFLRQIKTGRLGRW